MIESSALSIESDDEEIRMPVIQKAKSEGFRTPHKIKKEKSRQIKKIKPTSVKASPRVEKVEDPSPSCSAYSDANTSADTLIFVCDHCDARYSSPRALGGHVSK